MYNNEKEIRDIINKGGKLDWEKISIFQTLSEEFIREFQDKVQWEYISMGQELSEYFIREFQDKLDWEEISEHQELSEYFIRESQDKLDWEEISNHQTLSEEFIREFQDEVYWGYISRYQKLLEEFIGEFRDKITFNRPTIIFNRDIKPLDPCKDGVERYLSHTRDDEEISWNTLLERHEDRSDIWWLLDELRGER